MTTTHEQAATRGLTKDIMRALGWLALGKGVSKLPSPNVHSENDEGRTRRDAPMRSSKLVTAAASVVGLALALFPRERGFSHP